MKVLLIYPNITDYPIDVSYGLAAISSALKKSGHIVQLYDCTFGYKKKKLESIIHEFTPEIIGITIASNDFIFAIEICSFLKLITNVPIVAGGFHATLAPEDILAEDCFDIAVIGEGEQSITEIASFKNNKSFYKDLNNIDGIWFRNNGKIIQNKLRPLSSDIERFSYPDKSIFNYQKYININRGLATFITSYGCPYECTYCINKELIRKFGKPGFVRFKSVNYLIKEIKSIISNYNVREIEFYDDTFTINKQRTIQFCKIYSKKIGLPFCINSRADTINKDLMLRLKDAGCIRVAMGIETGDTNVRNKVLKRNQSDKVIIEAFMNARDSGLKTLSYNMIGIPYETKESIRKTIDLNRICSPDFIAISIFNAYKGTEIYDVCKKNGWLRHDRGLAYFQTSNVAHPNFTLTELKHIRNSFGYEVFKGLNYKRAVIDLVDKKLLTNRLYQKCRSYLINHGIKDYL